MPQRFTRRRPRRRGVVRGKVFRPKGYTQKYRKRRHAGIPAQPFLRDMYCKLKYNDTYTLASTAGALGIQTFRLNSLFDCDQTGSGHQPRFFDTLCGADAGSQPYGKYRVHSAVIKVRFLNSNSSVTSVGYCGIHIRTDDSTAFQTTTSFPAEIPHTKYKVTNVSTGINNFQMIRYPVSMKKYLGHKDLTDVDATAAEYNASPSDVVNADVFYYPRDSSTTASIQIDVMLEFFVQFFDQNLPNYS